MRKLFLLLFSAVVTTLACHALTVNNTAGQLSEAVGGDVDITTLVVKGTMDARDFKFITSSLDELTLLDLSQVTIAPYNDDKALYGVITTYRANEIPRTAFFGKRLTSVVLPTELEAIGFAAFAGCDMLQSVTLPESVTMIHDYAFAGTGLTSIVLPATVEYMGKGVFSRCEALQSAVVNAQEVGDFAFLGDVNLTSVQIGALTASIGEGAFNGCTALATVNFDPACHLSRIGSEAFINSGLKNIDISTLGLNTIGDWALAQTKLSSVSLTDGLTHLGEGALAHNPLLTSVTLPGIAHSTKPGRNTGGRNTTLHGAAPRFAKTLERIYDYTFAGDDALNMGRMLRNGVSVIGNYAFYNVSTAMDTVFLPGSVEFLGNYAMAGMTGMQTLKADATEVPALGENVWAGVDQPSVPLITPSESTSLYKGADQWMNFFFAGPDYIPGDVNRDGVIDVSDITMLIDYILTGLGDIDLLAADVNNDGDIDISDVTLLTDILLSGSAKISLEQNSNRVRNRITTSDALAVLPVSICPGETRTVDVALESDEHNYTALQCDLVLPQGIKLVGIAGEERGSKHTFTDRANELNSHVYSLLGVSMDMRTFDGSDGKVMRLTIAADENFGGSDASIMLTNVLLVTPKHEIYLAGDALTRVNDNTGIEQVTAGKEIAGVRYINVAGQESETPFSGVNIVVTTYTDGTTSTAKVMK